MDDLSLFSSDIGGADEAAPEWVHLVPSGIFRSRSGQATYRLNDAKAFLRRTWEFHKDADISVDYHHQSLHAAKGSGPAPAAGWIKDLEARQDGIWGRVEWTAGAHALIASREFRYVSPVLTHQKAAPSQPVDVGLLYNVALTNTPDLELMSLNEAPFPDHGDPTMSLKDKIAALLEIDADAADDVLLNALKARLEEISSHSAEPDPRHWVPRDQVQRMIQDGHAQTVTMHAAEVERLVGDAMRDGKLPPALKGWAVSLCSADPESFKDFVGKAPVIVAPGPARALPGRRRVAT